jgi:hypothetical protein
MTPVLERLKKLAGTRLCDGAVPVSLDFRLAGSSVRLPEDHVQLLQSANGASGYYGYFRLFGIGCPRCIDLVWWNDHETWKFAWPRQISRYLAFGETGWGDQYAYDIDALLRGDSTVFLLDAFEMSPEQIASNFSDFLSNEFARQADEPYDSITKVAASRIGPLHWNEHVTYIPSLLLGGEERIENVHRIDARASMIINGDIATQAAAEPDRLPASVQTFQDDLGRLRTRVVWHD